MVIAQITDTHITHVGGYAEREEDTTLCLERTVDHLSRISGSIDVLLVTGDCVDGGSEAEYERFRDMMCPLKMPTYVIPGNHDDRVEMRRIFGPQGTQELEGFVQYVVDEGPVRLIALDTKAPGPGGVLCEERLNWLEARLAEAPKQPTVIFQHHPPMASGFTVADHMGLRNPEALGAIIARYPNVERIIAGHFHCPMQSRFYGTLALSCPSTNLQMFIDITRTKQLSGVMEPPACLLHVWSEDIGLTTLTSYIGDYGPTRLIDDGKGWLPSETGPN
jgi:Icc protein